MKIVSKYFLVVLLFCLTDNVLADKVCFKVSIAGERIKQKSIVVPSANTCPKRFTEIVNTATLTGAPGPQGPSGTFAPTLPPGQLVMGTFGDITQGTAGVIKYVSDTQTFPFALSKGIVAAHYIIGNASTTECPGTSTSPDALAGHLCLYESTAQNRTIPVIENPATGSTTGEDSWRHGFKVTSNTSTPELIEFEGTYAVRAATK